MVNPFNIGREAFSAGTWRLYMIIGIYSLGNVFYGFDAASFGGVQAMTPFAQEFGEYVPSTKTYALPAKTASLMNSIPLIGKLLGTLIAGHIMTQWGHRWSMVACCVTQIIGVILQLTTHTAIQYGAGRFLVYIAVGIVENVVPAYASELAPAPLRGFFVGSLQPFLNLGSLVANIVNYFCARSVTRLGWLLASGIQAVPAVMILVLLPLTVDSPRWLITRDRVDDAVKVLRKVRTRAEIESGGCEFEIAAIREAGDTTHRKAPWLELFKGPVNRRRTGIAVAALTLYQLCGVTFVSAYGPTFYKQVGLASHAFAYQCITQACAVVAGILGMIFSDYFGRRNLTIIGSAATMVCLCIAGGLGSIPNPTWAASQTMVAFLTLFLCCLGVSIGPVCYIVGAEVGTGALREKTIALGTAMNVVSSFAVVFTFPYISVTAGLGSKTAYIYAGFCFLTAVWALFCLPELKDRSLEELDELFNVNPPLHAWNFKKYQTSGPGRLVREIEHGHGYLSKQEVSHTETIENIEDTGHNHPEKA